MERRRKFSLRSNHNEEETFHGKERTGEKETAGRLLEVTGGGRGKPRTLQEEIKRERTDGRKTDARVYQNVRCTLFSAPHATC